MFRVSVMFVVSLIMTRYKCGKGALFDALLGFQVETRVTLRVWKRYIGRTDNLLTC